MALYATNRFAGDGTTTQYEINFVGQYIDRSHVKAYRVDNATQVRTPVVIAPWQWLNATTITGFAPTSVGQTLVIYRDTPKPPMVDFVNGSRLTEYNLDLVARQGLFVAMEALDSNDHEAIDELLAAIDVVVGLVSQATAAVADATAAALAAAGSAADALGYRDAAQAAQTAAVTARNAAQASAGNAATSAIDAGNSATAAASSASAASTSAANAAASASTASTQASNAADSAATANTKANAANTSATNAAASATAAGTSATNAATSATNAANSAAAAITSAGNAATSAIDAFNSATAAAGSAAAAANAVAAVAPMACRVVVVNAASRIVRLERCGGQVVTLGGVVRTLPAAGIQLTLTSTSTPQHLYAGWNGSAVVFIESATAPVFDTTLAQWVSSTNNSYAAVAYVRPDGLATPERFLRNYYNGPGAATYTQALTSDYTANWDGLVRQLMASPILLLPGDAINVQGLASVMSTPAARVGDLTLVSSGSTLGRARHSYAGDTYVWHNYYCMSNTIQRLVTDAPSQSIFELYYTPISNGGSTWTALGDGASTKLIVNIAPYRWA